jgi:calcineurin-like phosphoesterase family protein
MNAVMIDHWNRKVTPRDEVVILGDFSYGTAEQTNQLLDTLNGKKYLIYGNHDRFVNAKGFDTFQFKWIKPYAELSDDKRKVILCHYPVFCYNGQYKLDAEGNPTSYMLYGHVHNTEDERLVNQFIRMTRATEKEINGQEGLHPIPCNMINCFCRFSDYTPLSLDEWIENDRARREAMDADEPKE